MPVFSRRLAVWTLIASLGTAVAVHGAVSLVSEALPPGELAPGDRGASTMSGDGRYLFYLASGAAGDGRQIDLYRRSLADGATDRVTGLASGTLITAYSASGDGRRVAFTAVVPAETPAGQSPFRSQVYLKDFDTGELRLVSANENGVSGDADSGGPVLSADGRQLLFESRASNLGTGPDGNLTTDVFLHEVASTSLRRLSRAANGAEGDFNSGALALSDDGAVALFRSEAANLVPTEPGIPTDLYVWSVGTQSSRRVYLPGTAPAGGRPLVRASNPVLSQDGRRLAFRSDARSQLAYHGVWWFDLTQASWTGVRASGKMEVPVFGDDTAGPVMAAGGGRLAFETLAAPGRIVIWDADTGLHTMDDLVIVTPAGSGAPANCVSPVLSPRGEWLAFLTESPVPEAGVTTSGDLRLYVRRLSTGETWTPLPGALRVFEMPFVEFAAGADWIQFQTEAAVPGLADNDRGLDVVIAAGPAGPATLATPRLAGTVASSGNAASDLGPGAVSLDGRWVVFTSTADNLVAGDTNGRVDVFVRDLRGGATRRVSIRSDGGESDWDSWTPRISGNGRYVAFMSTATNLVDGDINASPDIFVRDLVQGTTVLASARDEAMDAPSKSRGSVNPVISADGRYVAFESAAKDLVPGIALAIGGNNVFLRDLVERRTRLLSANLSQPFRLIEGQARSPIMSDDGGTVAFIAGSSSTADLYLYSVAENRLVPSSADLALIFKVGGAALSADGSRAVYFRNHFGNGLWWRDNRTGVASVLPGLGPLTDITEVAISGNGRRAAFVSQFQPEGSSDTNGLRDVFVVDLDSGVLRSASAPVGGGAANGPSDSPVFSADGRRIAFRTRAGNLDGDAPSESWNIAVRDLDSDLVTLVSRRNTEAFRGQESSGHPLLTADGQSVLFQSAAPLVSGDENGVSDVFLAPFPISAVADTDGDSMPDAWERVHFGNLGRDGSGDFDGDGAHDRDEYIVGTDPTVEGSVFRVTAGSTEGAGPLAVTFPSVVGVTYRLEVAPVLPGAAFTVVGAPVPGTGQRIAFAVPVEGSSGFVRVAAFR